MVSCLSNIKLIYYWFLLVSLIVEISCNRKKLFKLQVLTQLAEIISVKKGHLMVIYLACCKNLINIFLMCRYAWFNSLLWFSWGLLSKERRACLHFSSFWSSWSACWAACKVVWLLCCWKCWKQRKGHLLNMSAWCFNSINIFFHSVYNMIYSIQSFDFFNQSAFDPKHSNVDILYLNT